MAPPLAFLFLAPAILGAAPAAAAEPATTLKSLGKCLAPVSGPNPADGDAAAIWTCNGSVSQRWSLPPRGMSGPIVGPAGKCLDVAGGSTAPETPIILFGCHGLPNQLWRHEVDGRIVGLGGRCLDVFRGEPADGTRLILFPCHEGGPTANQVWQAEETDRFHSESLRSPARLLRLAASPGRPDRIFAAGGPNGILRSENGGLDWAGVYRGVDLGAGVEEVVADPRQPDVVYALENGRLLRSKDGGRSFLAATPPARLHSLAADPRRAGRLLALDGTSLYESADGGDSFVARPFPTQQSPDTLRQVIFDPLVPRRLWIAAAAVCAFCTGPDQGVFRSDDDGATWSRVFVLPTHRVVADPANSGRLFALVDKHVYGSLDAGASWQLLASFGGLTIDLWADLREPGLVLVSYDGGVARSENGGASFQPVVLDLRTGSNGAPVELVSSFLKSGDRLLAALDASDGHPGRGVLESTSQGVFWALRSIRGFAAGRIAAIASGDGWIWAAGREGIQSTLDDGVYYTPRLPTTGPASATGVLPDPFDPSGNTIYAATSRAAGAPGFFIWKSTDHGLTWQGQAGADGQPIETGGLVATQYGGRRFYLTAFEGRIAGTSFQGVISNDGQDWRPIEVGMKVRCLATHPGGVVYAGGEKLRRSRDAGRTWQTMQVFTVDAMATSGGDLFLAGPGFFYASADQGKTVETRELPAAISFPSAMFATAGRIFLGDRAGGLYSSADRGRSWTALDLGLPASAILALHVDPRLPNRLWVGTEGAGLYSALIDAAKAPLQFAGDRFSATIAWKDFAGATGSGRAAAWTAESGYFWFFLPDNVEVMVKVLDGRTLNGNYWVFVGSLSNVEFTLTVRDEWTGAQRVYHNPLGAFASFGDTGAFPGDLGSVADASPRLPSFVAAGLAAGPPAAGAPAAATSPLVTVRGRFEIGVEWDDGNGQTGKGFGRAMTGDTAAFNFFSASNTELVIKVLDGTSINGHHWVFYGALSNVGYTIRIRDLETGEQVVYHNPVGEFGSVGDIEAF